MQIPLSVLEEIAREELFIRTLETRKHDSLDFHDVSAWGVKSALDRAFVYGQEEAFRERGSSGHPLQRFSERQDERLAIAKKHMGFETLERRKSDSLDFKDVAVWCVLAALTEAAERGATLAHQTVDAEQKVSVRPSGARRSSSP